MILAIEFREGGELRMESGGEEHEDVVLANQCMQPDPRPMSSCLALAILRGDTDGRNICLPQGTYAVSISRLPIVKLG